VLAATVVPTLFFLSLEGSLRLAGVGVPTSFFIQLERSVVYTTNPHFGWRFFPPTAARAPVVCEMAMDKPDGVYRIFILGSSAAQGYPNPAFGFGRMLEAMLREQFPNRQFEVVNTAMTAVNSHVILPIARECAQHQPDLFVVYMGNNEVVGPFGSGTIFQGYSPSLPLIRSHILVKSTRLGQVLERALASRPDHREWRGMSMFLEHRVAADDSRMETVYRHFRANLTDICEVARQADAPIVLCTVATNLRDSPPFASLHARDLKAKDRVAWDTFYEAAIASADAGELEEAVKTCEEAARIDDRWADLHFLLGRCLLELKRSDEARKHFVLARDLDALRFRADTRINQTIRDVAAERADQGVLLMDVERIFAESEFTPDGITGAELFYEHVHFNPEGNYLLAKLVLQEIAARLIRDESDSELAPPSRQRCFELLALTDSNRYQMQADIALALQQPPFTAQLGADERERQQQRLLAGLRTAANSPAALQTAARWYAAALTRAPEDPALLREYAQLLERHGNQEAAKQQWLALVRRFPYVAAWRLECGQFLLNHGDLSEAVGEFQAAARLDAALAGPAHVGVASAAVLGGNPDEAEQVLREALEPSSHPVVVRNALGVLLFQQDRLEEAREQFQQVLRVDPDLAAPHANLAVIGVKQHNVAEAVRHVRELLRLQPYTPEAVWILEEICARAAPDPEHLDMLAQAYAAGGRFERAVATAESALELAESQQEQRLAESIRQRLSSYRQGKLNRHPTHEAPPESRIHE